MSLFDDASLVLTPNGYKASKLYSIKPTSGLGDMTVVRATTATRVNSAGVIESVAINVPRLDYPPLGGCPSILVEPLRTNLVFPSATLTTQTRTVTAVAHTLSFYGTGTIVLSGVHIATLTGTGANNRVTLTFTPTAGSLILTVTGTVTNAQLEAGANATSYIPTVAATVTRNADVISKTGVSSLIGQTEGTIFVDVNFEAESFAKYYLTLGNSGSFNIAISAKANNKIGMEVFNTTGQVNASSTSTYTTNQRLKIAMTYKVNDFKLYVNGVLQATDTAGTVPATAAVILGSTTASLFQATDGINLASIFTTALSSGQCISLTTL